MESDAGRPNTSSLRKRNIQVVGKLRESEFHAESNRDWIIWDREEGGAYETRKHF